LFHYQLFSSHFGSLDTIFLSSFRGPFCTFGHAEVKFSCKADEKSKAAHSEAIENNLQQGSK